ncbi:aminopeptidase N [Shewanella psychrotolerans]|uniref:aminopeptidase N n=1 Tax=Shewanella psychrotolerans TaxID=2864206 RepID=UPI001C65E00E|nr:aminopeptidase N [Shewanella psychrotolerans]QYK02124.1 aminopeptidase N [Shewanella psychrotolerans]
MKLIQLCIVGVISLLLTACQSTTNPKPNLVLNQNHSMSAQQALLRAKRVSDVNYQLDLELTHPRQFSGNALISFNLSDTEQPLALDFNQANVTAFTINGSKVYPNYDGKRLSISAALLNHGNNQISLQFRKPYSQTDQGLIRYTDPIDGNTYLYSHFLPSSAQMMVPQFDQPDLKAVYDLTVTAPNGWTVISASTSSNHTKGDSATRWQFAATQPISPHSFSLHAGPYKHWRTELEQLPINLYARQSIAEQVDSAQWFEQTRQALTFYQQQLGIPYPFSKYDQLLVPKLPQSMMANAAVSTFEEPTLETKQLHFVVSRAIAEQWFSNLVTLRWWDDLWFSQSLATFMANKSLAGKPSAAIDYQDKYDIYQIDERDNSQPIETAVTTSQQVDEGVPPSTIKKGVALLTQLSFLLGEKPFYQGLNQYLKQYQYGTATLNEFMATLAASTKRPLDDWTTNWFYRSGVNQIEAQYQCNNNRISYLSINQSASDDSSVLRQQKVKLGLFTLGRQALHPNLISTVTYDGQTTNIKRLQGIRCPDLVFPNYEDLGYVRVKLDPRSLETALIHLHKIENAQLRSMLWQTLWGSVLEGDLPLNRFLGSVLINAPHEQQPMVLAQLIDKLEQTKALLEQMSPNQQSYSQKALRALEQMSLRLTMTQTQDQIKSLWFNAYINFATSHQAIQHLAALLAGTEQLTGINLDQKQRWAIIIHLNRYDYSGAQRLLFKEKQVDSSEIAAKYAMSAEVAQPKATQKRRWFERVQQHDANSDPLMLDKLTLVMKQLYPSEQKALSQATAEQRLAELTEVDKRNSPEFMRLYTQFLLPMNCSYASVAKLTHTLNNESHLSQVTKQGLERALQTEKQCLLVKERIFQ